MFRSDDKGAREEFVKLIDFQHFDALISDAFWYFICSNIKEDKKRTGVTKRIRGRKKRLRAGGAQVRV